MVRVQTRSLMNSRPVHGVFQPVFEMKTSKIPATDIKVEVLRSILEGEKFAPGSIQVFPEEGFKIGSLRPKKLLGLQVCTSPDQKKLTEYFWRRGFTSRRNHLLALIILAVEHGCFPLPAEDETARMIFPYLRILSMVDGPFAGGTSTEVHNYTLEPVGKQWLLKQELYPDCMSEGELLVLLEK